MGQMNDAGHGPAAQGPSPRPPLTRGHRLARGVLLAVALLVILYAAGSWYMASQVTRAERVTTDATPASVGLEYEDVTFPSRDGAVTLRGWYVPGDAGVIILVHGLDSHKASEGVGALDLARRLHERGFGLLLFDLRGHGDSGDGRLSGGQFEQQDLLGAADMLAERGVPYERMGVLGFSLGGAVALLAAAQEPRLRAVAVDSTFADLGELINQEASGRSVASGWAIRVVMPGMLLAARVAYGIDLGAIVPSEALARLDYPVLIMHSRDDTRITVDHALRLKAAARNPDTELWLVDGASHARIFKTYPDAYVERVASYFNRRLR